jgi:hypothetical protein
MTILTKMNATSADFANVARLSKALGSGYSFGVNDIVQAEFQAVNKPRLLTSLLMSEMDVNSHITNSFVYDVVQKSLQLPGGKSFTERGPDLDKDKAIQRAFTIPSFGLVWNVAPQDYRNKRRPGGAPGELMDEAYVAGLMQEKAVDGWDVMNELAIATLITDDQNIVRDGPGTQYTFHEEFFGTARPAAINLNLAGTTEMANRQTMVNLRRQLQQRVGLAGKSMRDVIVLAGDTFFQERMELEALNGLSREIRQAQDLASQRVPEITAGGMNYDAFTGIDGTTYVNYGSSILAGTQLIDDDLAFMLPIGVENFMSIELAPAVTRSYVNQEAQAMYMWTKVDERAGVLAEMESNRLYMNRNPEFIIPLRRNAA